MKFPRESNIRVLIVDDSAVMRQLATLAMESDPSIEVIGTAANGVEAIERVIKLKPDLVTMDIEMPEMDGLAALRQIRRLAPEVRVIMLSTLTTRGASLTLEALSLGADDYVTKIWAAQSPAEATARLAQELVPKTKQFFHLPAVDVVPSLFPFRANAWNAQYAQPSAQVVAVGASTGGPAALASLLGHFPADFHLPILIVQHMPALFTQALCQRLQARTKLSVREAVNNEPLKPRGILLAPGDFHMRVQCGQAKSEPRIALDQAPPQNSCRPSVDILFESLAQVYGGGVVAVVLTGMGQDGLRGSRLLRGAGATIFAQDEKTSTVWGMPRALVEAKVPDAVLPLDRIVPSIMLRCERARIRRGSLMEVR